MTKKKFAKTFDWTEEKIKEFEFLYSNYYTKKDIMEKMELSRAQYERHLRNIDLYVPNKYINWQFINLTEYDKAYIAGIIDGEGCIRLNGCGKIATTINFVAQLKINNTDPNLIIYLYEKIGLGNIYIDKRRKAKQKRNFAYNLTGNQCIRFLHVIYDYLLVKKKEADIIFEFEKISPGRRKIKPTEDIIIKRRELFNKLKDIHHIELEIPYHLGFKKSYERLQLDYNNTSYQTESLEAIN